ncbi:MAG: penicillin-binding protein 2 [Bacteroidetes bacterium]|nr:penicillin-binding protein 2 [Bacteroidota bacterium]
MSVATNPRQIIVRLIFIGMGLVILARLLFLQLFEDKYKIMANDIAIFRKVVYPPRGVIIDRKGRTMCYNEVVYDLMVTPSRVSSHLDTATLCNVLGFDKATFEKNLLKTRVKTGSMRQGVFIEQLSAEQTARFKENMYLFDGFELLERSIRSYPNSSAGIFLGYIGEVSPKMLERPRYSSYRQGDYVGMNGLESSYEEVLRGQRGVYYYERDNFNRPRDAYKKGALDTPAIAGRTLQLSIDAQMQEYAEKLMANKIGSVVAIDPKTGGILTMVSSPSFDPNLLKGRDRTRNFSLLFSDARHPLFNRATQAAYNPGSAMKPITGLVALDVGAITPAFGYPCRGGYYACGRRIACTHSNPGHAANLRLALANSCNSYFVHIFRLIEDARRFGGVKKGLQAWTEYMYNLGLGHPTGVDIPFEGKGLVPDSALYNKMYNGSWNSCTNLFVGMGQGEVALTPLQLANAMCIIANRGYYYTPHFVRSIDNNPNDSLLKKYKVKHSPLPHTDDSVFVIIGKGMQDVVDKGTGKVAQLPGIEICAKTGTVENKAVVHGQAMKMKDHSVFVAFAPRENPKIAVAVIVENAGFGATWAGPVASLLIEKYLTDSIAPKRKYLEDKLVNAHLINPYIYAIDSAQKRKDLQRWQLRQETKRFNDSSARANDSIMIRNWFEKQLGRKLPTVLSSHK